MNKIAETIAGETASLDQAWRDFPGVEGQTYMNVAARGQLLGR